MIMYYIWELENCPSLSYFLCSIFLLKLNDSNNFLMTLLLTIKSSINLNNEGLFLKRKFQKILSIFRCKSLYSGKKIFYPFESEKYL